MVDDILANRSKTVAQMHLQNSKLNKLHQIRTEQQKQKPHFVKYNMKPPFSSLIVTPLVIFIREQS